MNVYYHANTDDIGGDSWPNYPILDTMENLDLGDFGLTVNNIIRGGETVSIFLNQTTEEIDKAILKYKARNLSVTPVILEPEEIKEQTPPEVQELINDWEKRS